MRFDPSAASFGDPTAYAKLEIGSTPIFDDFNNDGFVDIAAVSEDSDGLGGQVLIALNDGEGGFSNSHLFSTGAAPSSTFGVHFAQATGDFNTDGVRDLVVSNWDADRITVHLGTGGGFFSTPIVFTEDRPSSVGVADFNQDGNDDFFRPPVRNGRYPYPIW